MLSDYLALLCSSLRVILTSRWPQGLHRLGFLALFLTVWPLFTGLGRLCMALDRLLYPGLREVEVRHPVFIVGTWRTGSTFLHRTLAQDQDTFASLRTVDQFLPAVVQKRAMWHLGRLDKALGGHVLRLLLWLDDRFLPAYSRIHDMGLLKVEEDEFMLLHSLSSTALHELFAEVPAFRRFLHFDRDTAPAQRQRAMELYREMVKRHLFHVGTDKHFLSKNPLFSTKIESLRQVFPDARFIHLVRDPMRAFPSTASLLHHIWHAAGTLHPDESAPEWVMEQCALLIRTSHQALDQLPDQHTYEIDFQELVSSPDPTIRAALSHLDLPLSDAMARILPVEKARGKRHKSKHSYELGDFDLTEEGIYEDLEDLYEIYGWPVPESVQTKVA